ncbi:MAG TPA: ATP-dependent 6-phosphofructokinase [Pyrinomonadaceae bacterium]|nr:ATP-dependent 6-phosphofructokinase [Pyrinomonadaceae bacterium]
MTFYSGGSGMRVGVLTGGGDAPGLNPAIKGLVYRGSELGLEVFGLFDGWRSLLNPRPDVLPLNRETVRRWDRDGGTNLGSSRTNPFRQPMDEGGFQDRSGEVIENLEKLALEAVVVCGGEDTLGVAAKLAQSGVCVIGIPKTIDKDIAGTDYTLGFDTALRNISEVIERSRTPAGSHGWVQIIEVMGRHAGHLALWSGVAGQAHIILIPERPFRYERVFRLLKDRLGKPGLSRGPNQRPRYAVIVVAEGARAEEGELITLDDRHDAFGHARLGGIGDVLARRIARDTPYESRAVILGHPQRGGPPSAIDRIMGLMFGARAAEAVAENQFGKMVSARGIAPACEFSLVDISMALGKISLVDIDRDYDLNRYHLKNSGM